MYASVTHQVRFNRFVPRVVCRACASADGPRGDAQVEVQGCSWGEWRQGPAQPRGAGPGSVDPDRPRVRTPSGATHSTGNGPGRGEVSLEDGGPSRPSGPQSADLR